MTQHPVSKEHLIEIGNITVYFALFENEFKEFFSELTQLKDNKLRISIIIASELSIRQLFQLVNSIYIEVYGKDSNYNEFIEIIRQAERVNDKRNLITHSIWGAGKENAITRIKIKNARKGTDFQAESYFANDIAIIAKEIDDVKMKLQDFRIKVFYPESYQILKNQKKN